MGQSAAGHLADDRVLAVLAEIMQAKLYEIQKQSQANRDKSVGAASAVTAAAP